MWDQIQATHAGISYCFIILVKTPAMHAQKAFVIDCVRSILREL
jgi:hypothetical protein